MSVLTMEEFMALMPAPAVELTTNEGVETLLARFVPSTTRTYRLPSVRDALGVPSIQGAVSLIAGTTGMLSMAGYRNGVMMADPPRLITRPDPYQTPQAFYAGTAACMAKYGEFVWWIASRDGTGAPSALQTVPLHELTVEENTTDRIRPIYRWGSIVSTRYTPATPTGAFVHVKYVLGEPYALRGEGPLQMCGAAASVSVEAQAWAAQFYADGGNPSVIIKHAGELSPELDEDGLNEADRLRAQWVNKPHNVPRVIDQNIESVEYKEPNASGAQMLQAREHQNGDAARMFRIPGSLLEFSQPGASLTYQNLEGEFTKFVRTCLQPLYLEAIEQAMSDLLGRSIVARFNVKGFLRADIKTRFEVHGIAIDKGIYDQAYAQREEGILPGDIEYAPVPASPPQAIPSAVPRAASMVMRDVRCPGCSRLLGRVEGGAELHCRHCKAPVTIQASHAARLPEPAPDVAALRMADAFMAMAVAAGRQQEPPVVNNYVNTPDVSVPITFERGAVETMVPITVPVPEVRNEISVEPTPVTVIPPAVEVTTNVEPTPVNVTVEAAQIENRVEVAAAEAAQITIEPAPVTVVNKVAPPRKTTKRIVRDDANQITSIIEEEH